MSEISVAHGWQHILDEAVAEAAALPEEWCFEIVKAETVDGALKISTTYVSGDVPLDDHLPSDSKLPHPFRAMMRIREAARQKSLVTCECCGRIGRLVGSGDDARVRCAAHVDVVDAMGWVPPADVMFETDEEALAHFLDDYGGGLDAMQELSQDGDDDTRH
ncbi:hypothetical protein [Hoeflea olei]|uniref:Uncharacterized protein n=1 Tax=Hoeflea olei TaxID=1480615 RepID=A0A1C1YRU7_9HYPH|nr:hypothetical protein [Hoeflea olei]OCW56248.1 hypothetical protein AWJ14_19330 [Hoeflea olei]